MPKNKRFFIATASLTTVAFVFKSRNHFLCCNRRLWIQASRKIVYATNQKAERPNKCPTSNKKGEKLSSQEQHRRTRGELNFAISVLVDGYLKNKGGIKYSHLNEVVGALDCAKLELYRRVAAPYEDKKMEENGDVYKSNEKSPHASRLPQIEK